MAEGTLKAKGSRGVWSRLRALATMDEIAYKCLVWGFPFMTLGLISGAIVGEARQGAAYFADPKILLSILTWVLYVVVLYTRWSAGWRGRRAAYLANAAFATALLAWAANNLRRTHRDIAPGTFRSSAITTTRRFMRWSSRCRTRSLTCRT